MKSNILLEYEKYDTRSLLEYISHIILKNTHIVAGIYKNFIEMDNYETINYYINFSIKKLIEYFIDRLEIPISLFSHSIGKYIDYSVIDRVNREIKIIFLNTDIKKIFKDIIRKNNYSKLNINIVNMIPDSIDIDTQKCYFEISNYITSIIRRFKY